MKIIYVGNAMPEDAVADSGVHDANIADNIAQIAVIRGLHERFSEDLTVVSASAGTAPSKLSLGYGIQAITIPVSSLNAITYYFSAMVNYSRMLFKILRTHKSDEVIVITNGPYIYRSLAAILAKSRYSNVKWVPFLIGAVEVPEARFPFSLVSKLSRWTVRQADGAITYVARSVEDYMPQKPYAEIVYLIDDALMRSYSDVRPARNEKFTITYTGALTSIYNIDLILDVIRGTGTTYRWVFAGVGPYASEIEALSKNDQFDVEYLGRVSNLEAVKLQKASDLLLCIKGGDQSVVNHYYSKYAAAGKLTEYLCSGTPILASDIPAFSGTIRPFATFGRNRTVSQTIEDIADIKSNYAEKLDRAAEGQAYAFQHFNADYQNKKICDFIESLRTVSQ